MDVAFIEHAQHDVDGDEGGEDQDGLVRQRILEGRGGALERGLDADREADLVFGVLTTLTASPRRFAGRQVEGERDRRGTGPGG